MKISIIISTYEAPQALRKVLKGMLLQTLPPQEVIVADDGSGPETGEVLKEYKRLLPFPLLHVRHEHKGFRLAKIRNEALKVASGNYVVFLDGDCIPEPHFLEDHLRLAEKGFFFQGKRILLSREASEHIQPEDLASRAKLFGLMLKGNLKNAHHIFRAPFIPPIKDTGLKGTKGCNLAVAMADLMAVNGFNEDFLGWGREDSELVARLYKYGLRRKLHPFMALCYHLWHPEQPRERLKDNDALLEQTLRADTYRCKNGIFKEP